MVTVGLELEYIQKKKNEKFDAIYCIQLLFN